MGGIKFITSILIITAITSFIFTIVSVKVYNNKINSLNDSINILSFNSLLTKDNLSLTCSEYEKISRISCIYNLTEVLINNNDCNPMSGRGSNWDKCIINIIKTNKTFIASGECDDSFFRHNPINSKKEVITYSNGECLKFEIVRSI